MESRRERTKHACERENIEKRSCKRRLGFMETADLVLKLKTRFEMGRRKNTPEKLKKVKEKDKPMTERRQTKREQEKRRENGMEQDRM